MQSSLSCAKLSTNKNRQLEEYKHMKQATDINGLKIGKKNSLLLIAGPCVIENYDTTYKVASFLKEITEELKMPFIFKASFDKANRTSINSFRGLGFSKGLEILSRIKKELNLKIISDVHETDQIEEASKVLDVLQIPAFLCRQTDLIVKASLSGIPVNIKKGQFIAPKDMINSVKKARSTGNKNIFITERGSSFGYNNLVVDFRSIKIMQESSLCPVIFDATHSVQLPGGMGTKSGGEREFVFPLARAAVAAGCDGVFFEIHPEPDKALCDGANSLKLDSSLKDEFIKLQRIREFINDTN